ncbi:hypothetical protein EV217_5108 [Phyllobacterium myrsinacearum]|uniref:hypothetical protein n=1 Tax=Phyllobacterium myrsinacearum TaxID=28101 RepID=UPI001028DE24|nr:hypothetical protein [Phyllobacterium myrsinacearum]RZS76877.1 hypothetical protein EV217_5108 [Phyllobacterium myrsinacearum]
MAIPLICCYVDANVSLGARSIFEQAVDAPPESDPDLSDIILSQDDRFETLSADHIYIVRNRNAVAQGLVAIFQACEDDWSGKEDAQYLREEMATLVQMYSYLQTAEDVFDALTTA